VALKGVVVSPSGYSALLQGTDTRTYVVHVGDRLMDGQVRSIGADSLVLLQRSSDPLVVPKEVEIRKRLRQVGEGKP
jgi:Tfp pilus assembly protein PilP